MSLGAETGEQRGMGWLFFNFEFRNLEQRPNPNRIQEQGTSGQTGACEKLSRQQMPTEVKAGTNPILRLFGPSKAQMGSIHSRKEKRAGCKSKRGLGASVGLFNMQRADPQKSMLIFKTLLPEPPSLLESRVGVKYLSIYKDLVLQCCSAGPTHSHRGGAQ